MSLLRTLFMLIPLGLSVISSPSHAQDPHRKTMLPYIRAATDCVARQMLTQGEIVEAYRTANLAMSLDIAWKACVEDLGRIVQAHDYYYGAGTGLPFVKGPYRDDLQRAVLVRIRSELEQRVLQADREAQSRKQRAEAALTIAKAARDDMYVCIHTELRQMVRSAESADTLASAALVQCSRLRDAAVSRFIEYDMIDKPTMTPDFVATLRTTYRQTIRDNAASKAVKVKADFASQPSPAVPASIPPPVKNSKATHGLIDCFATVTTAQQGKFVDRAKAVDTMLQLCRPEIESLAREKYLSDTSTPLEKHRERTAALAFDVATELIKSPSPTKIPTP